MKEAPYDHPCYPNTWARIHGKGRVFYTALGHREDVWTNPLFQELLFAGILWALGSGNPSIKPNLTHAAPHASKLPPISIRELIREKTCLDFNQKRLKISLHFYLLLILLFCR